MSFEWGVTKVWAEHRDQDWREKAGQAGGNFRVGRGITDPGAKTIYAIREREAREIFARIRGIALSRVKILPALPRRRPSPQPVTVSPPVRQRSYRNGYCGQ